MKIDPSQSVIIDTRASCKKVKSAPSSLLYEESQDEDSVLLTN